VRFLIVDDEPDLRMILQLNLQRWGHQAVLAADTAEAYAHIVSDPPDAMLIDVSMPGETGPELLDRLRAEGRLPERVALLSAMIPSSLSAQGSTSGVRHLSKPFDLSQLQALIADMTAS
jgi:CheY-like chemotaxis protein